MVYDFLQLIISSNKIAHTHTLEKGKLESRVGQWAGDNILPSATTTVQCDDVFELQWQAKL